MNSRFLLGVVVLSLSCEGEGGGGLKGALNSLKDKLAAGAIDKAVEAGVKAATEPLSGAVAPAAKSKVVSLPSSVTGGVDTAKGVTGKSGSISQDMDGDGSPDSVDVLASDDGVTYLSWQTNGVCYLSWVDSSGKEYLQFASCGDESGAWVCSGNDPNYTCKGCAASGQCDACENNDLTTCVWGTSSDGGDGQDAASDDGGDDASDGGDDMTDMSDGETDTSDGETDTSDGETDTSDGETDMSDGGTDMSDGGTDMSDGGTDMSDGGTDMSDANDDGSDMTDMSDGSTDGMDGVDGSSGSTCSEVVACIELCDDDAACASDCQYSATAEATDLLVAWGICLDIYCEVDPDNCMYCDEEAAACLSN